MMVERSVPKVRENHSDQRLRRATLWDVGSIGLMREGREGREREMREGKMRGKVKRRRRGVPGEECFTRKMECLSVSCDRALTLA